ncbi:uncharacterized protein AC631_04615 [Debaryomyces fabryi]|uniref:Uncharacterized protein n=1 Tax=Debaryomyces fabryi TaxID=58627 RepID=A0A0V1PTM8_9ASCO|nr:uncharacterized protein AC631_04615 [Debaryomyces fabryi]KRZ99619.1 hypothetical protein AC631_04615 [Debaryomyces fabryi]CUM49821.1 unnamed protein product [Debaryomyces fabryi]
MSLQGAIYGIECTNIRQSLQDLREPVCEQYNDPFNKNSQFRLNEPEIDFSTSASLTYDKPQPRNNLHKLYRRLKFFSQRDKNKPAKDRSNQIFPQKTFRIKEDTAEEIAKTRWHVWNTFTRRIRKTSSFLSPPPAPFGYNYSLSDSPHSSAGICPVNLDQMFHSLDPRVDYKSPTTSASFSSQHP